MPEVVIRKIVTQVEDVFHEGGPAAKKPYRPRRSAGRHRQPVRRKISSPTSRVSWKT